jgi:hypothetical protein
MLACSCVSLHNNPSDLKAKRKALGATLSKVDEDENVEEGLPDDNPV